MAPTPRLFGCHQPPFSLSLLLSVLHLSTPVIKKKAPPDFNWRFNYPALIIIYRCWCLLIECFSLSLSLFLSLSLCSLLYPRGYKTALVPLCVSLPHTRANWSYRKRRAHSYFIEYHVWMSWYVTATTMARLPFSISSPAIPYALVFVYSSSFLSLDFSEFCQDIAIVRGRQRAFNCAVAAANNRHQYSSISSIIIIIYLFYLEFKVPQRWITIK